MNGWKAAWVEAGRGDAKNFRRLRSPQWRAVWGGRNRGDWESLGPLGAPRQAGAAGRTLAWEDGGAVSADPRRALLGLGLRLRLSLGPRPPSRWRPRPVSLPKPRAKPGPRSLTWRSTRGSAVCVRREPSSSAGREISWFTGGGASRLRLGGLRVWRREITLEGGGVRCQRRLVGVKITQGAVGTAGNIPRGACLSLKARQSHPSWEALGQWRNVASPQPNYPSASMVTDD